MPVFESHAVAAEETLTKANGQNEEDEADGQDDFQDNAAEALGKTIPDPGKETQSCGHKQREEAKAQGNVTPELVSQKEEKEQKHGCDGQSCVFGLQR
ncbi:MAG: hypothetical protein J5846_10630 [Desulfovibrio sp.]|nr:hypothetical protein [Desulfovibrio sp.]